MKVKTVKPFLDREAKCDRAIGDEFECSKARFDAINAAGFGVLVEQIEEAKPKAAPKRTTKAKKAE